MSEMLTRDLVFRFWNLRSSQRRDIALRLALISQDEIRLPEQERYMIAFLRCGERGQIGELARETAAAETANAD